jgi:AraC family L-rhamnose operon transcriptional activator RhaR/AraC family L-rhamnose operon regulatory protein RhaS
MPRKLRSARIFPEDDFRLRVMRCTEDRHGKRMAVPLHSHEFHELVVVMGGTGRHVMKGEEYPLAEGDVFLIRGKVAHGYAEPEGLSYVNVLFDPVTLRLPMDDLRRVPGYHVLFRVEPKLRGVHKLRGCLKLSPDQLAETSRLIALTEAELSEKHAGYRYMAVAHLMQMVGYLSRSHSRDEEPERRPLLKIGEVLSHIDKHYDEPVTVDALCEIADMSESSLARAFHEVVGRPPMDYVIRVRVGKAAGLLSRSRLLITDIAFRCGFSDSNYFSRQFRSVTGQSPRDYRRSHATRRRGSLTAGRR